MSSKTNKLTDFEIELGRIDKELSELQGGALAAPVNSESATRFVYRLYQRASLTGSFSELDDAERALAKAIELLPPSPDLYYLKANIDFKFHRLADVRRDLELGQGLRASFQGRTLEADLNFQEGRYGLAQEEYERLIREDKTWDSLARLAYLKAKMGYETEAEELYTQAEDELTAKEMRHYAWVELQRGVLDLTHGRYDEALDHYRRADKAYSGYWLTASHRAELLGAQGDFDEAVAMYEELCASVERPEFQQALGELYVLMGEPEKAEPWIERALAAYLAAAEAGGVHYYHHLVDLYSDARRDSAEAVKWARMDLELRENFSTQAAMAWALYLDNQLQEAMQFMNKALLSGVKDPYLYHQAAIIQQSLGNGQGKHYLQLAAEINPHYSHFHVHH